MLVGDGGADGLITHTMAPTRPAAAAQHHDRLLRGVGLFGLALFVAVTVAQHALVPQLGPRHHTVSEYANADQGWLMTAAFAAWALALAATALRELSPLHGRWVLAVLLAIASLGLATTAVFATQTSAGLLPPGTMRSTGGALHDLGSGAAQLALLGAVLATILHPAEPRVMRRLAAALFVSGLAVDIALLALGDPAAGIRQRLLLLVASIWHAALLMTRYPAPSPGIRESSSRATTELRSMSR